jgi:hypothetical protein
LLRLKNNFCIMDENDELKNEMEMAGFHPVDGDEPVEPVAPVEGEEVTEEEEGEKEEEEDEEEGV